MRWQDIVILLLLGAAFLFLRYRRRAAKRRLSRSPRVLSARQEKALALLRSQGYTLQEIFPGTDVAYAVNNRRRSFRYERDMLVTRGGFSYLVRIKSGNKESARFSNTAFRQEILLDYLFFRPRAILLFDADAEKFDQIRFESATLPAARNRLLHVSLILLIVAGLALLLILRLKP